MDCLQTVAVITTNPLYKPYTYIHIVYIQVHSQHLCLALSVKFISVCGQRKVGGKALRNIVHTKVTYLFLTISQAFKICSSRREEKKTAYIYLYIYIYIYRKLNRQTKTIVSKTKTTTTKADTAAAAVVDRELATGS